MSHHGTLTRDYVDAFESDALTINYDCASFHATNDMPSGVLLSPRTHLLFALIGEHANHFLENGGLTSAGQARNADFRMNSQLLTTFATLYATARSAYSLLL
tara:strand:+ start:50 stop:355 length:306 start_codon:yes stop_codon:yes gene_type:complete